MRRRSCVVIALGLASCVSAEGPVLVGPLELRLVAPARIAVTNGVPHVALLDATGTTADGRVLRVPILDAVSSDEAVLRIGDARANLIPTGLRSGRVTVTAHVQPRTGAVVTLSTVVDVRASWLDAASDVPAWAFVAAAATPRLDPSVAPHLTEPRDGAIIPADVPAIEVRWEGGRPGDVDLVTIQPDVRDPTIVVTAMLVHGDPGTTGAYTVSLAALRTLVDTVLETPVSIRVVALRSDAPSVVGRSAHIRFSAGAIAGSFVAQIADGDESGLRELDWQTLRRAIYLPGVRSGVDRCTGCHAFAGDGHALAVSAFAARTLLLADPRDDLSTDVARVTFPWPGRIARFPALGPSAAMRSLVVSIEDGTGDALWAFDASNFATPVPLATAFAPLGTHPAISPDGGRVAWIARHDGDPVLFTSSDLVIAPLGSLDTPRVLLRGGDVAGPEGGAALSHPSFSPDGRFIAVAHGPSSTMGYGAPAPIPQSIYLVALDGTSVVRLLALDPSRAAPTVGWPVFLPWSTTLDGNTLAWLGFASRAAFGTSSNGTGSSGTRQLWVSALDPSARRSDPSSPPLRVAGQDPRVHTVAAEFLPSTANCVQAAAICVRDDQCCEGRCTVHFEWGGVAVCE